MSRNQSFKLLFGFLLAASGCADSLEKRLTPQADAGDPEPEHVQHDEAHAVGEVSTLVIDASSQEDTIYFDLDSGRRVGASAAWDLSFRRFHVQMNGGVSGEGGVQAVALADIAFEDVQAAPEDGYSTDTPDGEADNDSDPDNLFNNGESDWYDYDVGDHTLTSRKLVYVVSTTEQQLFKFAIDDYYDAAGSPAILSVRWARLSGPAPEPAPPNEELEDAGDEEPDAVSSATTSDAGADAVGDAGADAVGDAGADAVGDASGGADAAEPATEVFAVTVDASSSSVWIYVNAYGQVVTPADPAQSLDWDLAFKRTELRTNSGTSGPGQGGAKRVSGAIEFAQITEADASDFSVDEPFNSGAPGAMTVSQSVVLGDWYDYNPMNHTLTPTDQSYVVRTARGEHAKLRIVSWRDGVFEIVIGPIGRALAGPTPAVSE